MSLVCPGTPTDVRPSYRAGFAPRNGLPQYPRLCTRLVGLWAPYLGPTRLSLYNWSPHRQSFKGTLTNMDPATDWVTSRYGRVLDLDGADDYIDITGFTAGSTFSLFFLIRGGNAQEYMLDAETGRFIFGFSPATRRLSFYDGAFKEFSAAAISTDWVSILAAFNGVTGKADAWINGQPWGTQQNYTATSLGGAVALLSRWNGQAAYCWDGQLAVAAIWERVCFANEAAMHFRDPYALTRLARLIPPVSAAPPGAIMNLMQGANLGADLYNGTLAV